MDLCRACSLEKHLEPCRLCAACIEALMSIVAPRLVSMMREAYASPITARAANVLGEEMNKDLRTFEALKPFLGRAVEVCSAGLGSERVSGRTN